MAPHVWVGICTIIWAGNVLLFDHLLRTWQRWPQFRHMVGMAQVCLRTSVGFAFFLGVWWVVGLWFAS